MFQNKLYQNTLLPGDGSTPNRYVRQYNTALHQFRAILFKGKLSRLIRRILGRPQQLYNLNELKQSFSLRGSYYSGIQVVPISSIIGSEGRTADFDMDFHPLSESARERWVNIAIAHLAHIALPPIQLIQVGDSYFVRDGHHRISVSRAFGQVAMDAEVIIWKTSRTFPWQPCPCMENPKLLKSPHLST